MESQPVKACPFCGEMVLAVAIKCKHCQSMIGSLSGAAQPTDVAVDPGRASPLRWPPDPALRKSSRSGARPLILTVIGATAAVGLSLTNPTQEDFKKFISKRIEVELAKEDSINPSKTSDPVVKLGLRFITELVSGVGSFAIDKMTTRKNFGLFSAYEVDFSILRSMGLANQHDIYVIGIAGQFIGIPLRLGSTAEKASPPAKVLRVKDGERFSISGTVSAIRSQHSNGETFRAYTLKTDYAVAVINAIGEECRTDERSELHIVGDSVKSSLVGKKVTFTGNAFCEHTSWHARPVVMSVESLKTGGG